MQTNTDESQQSYTGSWEFARLSPGELQRHMELSIPGYDTGHEIIRLMSHYFIRNRSRIYDVGCGPGKLTRLLAKEHEDKIGIELIGVDPYVQFYGSFFKEIEQASKIVELSFVPSAEYMGNMKKADMVIMYYVLQFLAADERRVMLRQTLDSLNTGGALFVFEKVNEDKGLVHEMFTGAHERMKFGRGFSANEIMEKKMALMGCMKPRSRKELIKEISGCEVEVETTLAFKQLCFEGYIVIKK